MASISRVLVNIARCFVGNGRKIAGMRPQDAFSECGGCDKVPRNQTESSGRTLTAIRARTKIGEAFTMRVYTLAAFGLAAAGLLAQEGRVTISGNVTDPTGAAIPGVQVIATE